MKSFPVPALIAALAALTALPFSGAAASTFFMAAGLGFILHADYILRMRRVRLPRQRHFAAHTPSHARTALTAREPHRLAA